MRIYWNKCSRSHFRIMFTTKYQNLYRLVYINIYIYIQWCSHTATHTHSRWHPAMRKVHSKTFYENCSLSMKVNWGQSVSQYRVSDGHCIATDSKIIVYKWSERTMETLDMFIPWDIFQIKIWFRNMCIYSSNSMHSVIDWNLSHNDVMTWQRYPHYWPFVRGIHQWP